MNESEDSHCFSVALLHTLVEPIVRNQKTTAISVYSKAHTKVIRLEA